MATKIPLLKFESDVIKAARAGLKEAATTLENQIIRNATLTDHTLKDLADLGHPYSKVAPFNPHPDKPDYLVHTQSGRLQDNIRQVKEGRDAIAVGVNPGPVIDDNGKQYLNDVIEGTSKMVGRNFIHESFNEVQEEIFKVIEDEIKTAM